MHRPPKNWTSFWPTWVEKANIDTIASQLVHRLRHRPAEELYHIIDDPYEMRNLASDDAYQSILSELNTHLLKWMNPQGDAGQETEMEAPNHQVN